MPVTATTEGEWKGSNSTGFETAKAVAGFPPPATGWLYRRNYLRIDQESVVKGATIFTTDVGSSIAAGNADTRITNGADSIELSASGDFIVQTDDLIPNPQGSGIWKHVRTLILYEDWFEWEIPT